MLVDGEGSIAWIKGGKGYCQRVSKGEGACGKNGVFKRV